MKNQMKDRHVLAAAVKCGANAIVTENTKDFPPDCLRPYGIEPLTADDFLIHQYHFDKAQVLVTVEQQAAKIRTGVTGLLDLLALNAPQFVSLIRGSLNEEIEESCAP
jgi:hypothetical protein